MPAKEFRTDTLSGVYDELNSPEHLTLLSTKFMYTILKNSVPTSQKTHCASITKTAWLMLFREITAVYSENHTKRRVSGH
jgi:hypothetical protein